MQKLPDGKILSEAQHHHLIGNALCLDFANTLYGHRGTPLHEYLHDYGDLVVWSRKAGVLTSAEADRLLRLSERRPEEAAAAFHHAIAQRELIFRVFDALGRGHSPRSADLGALNASRHQALAHFQIVRSAGQYRFDWDDKSALDRMLWPIMLSAGELLTSDNQERIRQCSGETCDWLFVDTSRNHMRRWCQMRVCGNRAKARRFAAGRKKLSKADR